MMRCFLKHHWLTDFCKDKQACRFQELCQLWIANLCNLIIFFKI